MQYKNYPKIHGQTKGEGAVAYDPRVMKKILGTRKLYKQLSGLTPAVYVDNLSSMVETVDETVAIKRLQKQSRIASMSSASSIATHSNELTATSSFSSSSLYSAAVDVVCVSKDRDIARPRRINHAV